MAVSDPPFILATRGSALALVQTNLVLAQCQSLFPDLKFEIKIIKTTGDKLQTAPPDLPSLPGTKGLFTKELEVALLDGAADLAVHSLKDLPTDLPKGLELAAVLPRADVRDVFIYRDSGFSTSNEGGRPPAPGMPAGSGIRELPPRATVATSSTRRQAQLLALRPDLNVQPIRGNVGTRLRKLAEQPDLDGLILAAAGLRRLHFEISADGRLSTARSSDSGSSVPNGLRAVFLSVEEMMPCVGQGIIGIEGRADDKRLSPIFSGLNDPETFRCAQAERAFLQGMGGGCLSPVAAYAVAQNNELRLQAVSFRTKDVRRGERIGPADDPVALGRRMAQELNQ